MLARFPCARVRLYPDARRFELSVIGQPAPSVPPALRRIEGRFHIVGLHVVSAVALPRGPAVTTTSSFSRGSAPRRNIASGLTLITDHRRSADARLVGETCPRYISPPLMADLRSLSTTDGRRGGRFAAAPAVEARNGRPASASRGRRWGCSNPSSRSTAIAACSNSSSGSTLRSKPAWRGWRRRAPRSAFRCEPAPS